MDPSQMMSRSFPMWAPPPAPPSDDLAAPPPPPPQPFLPPPNRGWKRKNPPSSNAGYQPPALGDLQVQNRAKARRWFKNHNPGSNRAPNRRHFKAAAPRNTTSYIIRAKRAGGIASLVSPCPVTPAVLPTPRLSPSREGLADMAQAQWGVDGYGSMKGLIRLRSSPHPANQSDDDDDSSGSDVEEHVEVERRLDHDLSRFEMVYPAAGEDAAGYLFEDDDDYDQDAHVARLEEENLTLKERLFLMEQEVGDMRRRLEALEARFSQSDGFRENPEIHVGSENSAEDNVERVTEVRTEIGYKGAVDSEEGRIAGMDFMDSEKELLAEMAALNADKSGQPYSENGHIAAKDFMDSEKEPLAEMAAVDAEKSGQPDSEKGHIAAKDFMDSEKELVAEKAAVDAEPDSKKGAVDSEKSGQLDSEEGHIAGKDFMDSENRVEHDDTKKVDVDSKRSGKHDAEMIYAALEKTGVDDAEQSKLEASTRD